MKKKVSNTRLAFLIALFYIIMGTIYSYWTMTSMEGGGVLYYIFFPVLIFPSLILYTERDPWLMILICQVISLLIVWPFFWLIVHLLRNDDMRPEQQSE